MGKLDRLVGEFFLYLIFVRRRLVSAGNTVYFKIDAHRLLLLHTIDKLPRWGYNDLAWYYILFSYVTPTNWFQLFARGRGEFLPRDNETTFLTDPCLTDLTDSKNYSSNFCTNTKHLSKLLPLFFYYARFFYFFFFSFEKRKERNIILGLRIHFVFVNYENYPITKQRLSKFSKTLVPRQRKN